MIRLIQRRLIIPRGDTGTFQIPMLPGKNSGDASIFTIFDPLIHRKIFEKQMTLSDGVLNLSFSHGDTVNLPVGQYVWDIKFYTNPQFADEQLISGEEIDSYYAAFALPVCEIRETGDNLLMSDDAPQATLAPGQIDLITAVLQEITGAKDVAVASRDSAIDSAREAETSATQAEAYASDALGYKNDTLAAKDEALQAAIDATTQATNAAQSEANALQSASDADTSATAANAAKEAAIAAQNTTIAAKDTAVQAEADASAHEASASNSATLAANSASAAGLSEQNAQDYANVAALSEANARNSETNAAGSAAAAAASAQQAQATAQAIHEEIPTHVSDLVDDSGHYTKPVTGIPASDLEETYLTQHQDISMKANSADLAAVATSGSYNDLEDKPTIPDVQINGNSIVENGIANIPVASKKRYGVIKVGYGLSTIISTSDPTDIKIGVLYGDENLIKEETPNISISPDKQHISTFFGLSKAAGADLANEENIIVGTYPDSAKNAIQNMLGVPSTSTVTSEIAAAIGNINSFDMTVVQALPTEDINTHTIYLVPKTGETNDVYDEYVYINNNWEMVGNTQIDLSNYVQKTDYATTTTAGLVIPNIQYGIAIDNKGNIGIGKASPSYIKIGENKYNSIVPYNQHESTFYGLAKAAGDTTQSQSDNTVGTYTTEAKVAIRSMIGAAANADIPSLDNYVQKTDYATNNVGGVIKVAGEAYGIVINGNGILYLAKATDEQVSSGTNNFKPIVPSTQHISTFYGLAKAAGVQSESNVGTYTVEAKSAIQTMLDVPSKANLENLISIGTTAPTTSDSKIWIDTDDTSAIQVPTVAEMNAALALKADTSSIPNVPVEDVQVNGSSILSNGIANIPIASISNLGTVKINDTYGVIINPQTGELTTFCASSEQIKTGINAYRPINVIRQHEAVFYGLAKVAGHDEKNSTESVGTYTNEAKAAILNMFGLQLATDAEIQNIINGGAGA